MTPDIDATLSAGAAAERTGDRETLPQRPAGVDA